MGFNGTLNENWYWYQIILMFKQSPNGIVSLTQQFMGEKKQSKTNQS